MQLKQDRSIRGAIAALAAALVGHAVPAGAQTNQTDATLMLYNEANRITAAEALVSYRKLLPNLNTVRLNLTYDGLTGASPNGATPSHSPQTFTRPSGNSVTTIPAGEIPLDPGFKDYRIGADGQLEHPLNRLTNLMAGAHLSLESDYTSLGLSTGITRDLFQRNTTLGLSASFAHETSSPKGGAPAPFASLPPPEERGDREGEGEGEGISYPGQPRNIYDVVFGISQILDRSTIIRFNYSLDHAAGYLNDPYKLLSLVYGPNSSQAGEPFDYLYENRPRSRTKHALYGEIIRDLFGSTLDASYRHFWDTWGIRSGTVDASWRFPTGRGTAIQPHVRWYSQTKADFYQPFLVRGSELPTYASADARLAAFDAYTFGLTYSFPVMPGSHMSATTEYYFQKGDGSPPDAFGALRDFDLFPKLNAVMIRVGYTHDF